MISSTKSKISLKVEDAYPRDIGRGVVRIDFDSMDVMHASTRDIIEIKGKRKTLAVCLPLYPSDDGRGIVRADKIVQNNAQSQFGSSVYIRKVRRNISKHVTIVPLQSIPPGMERYLRDALDGVPVISGDEIAVRYFGKFVYFQVIKATPAGVISDTKTKFRIKSDDSKEKLSK